MLENRNTRSRMSSSTKMVRSLLWTLSAFASSTVSAQDTDTDTGNSRLRLPELPTMQTITDTSGWSWLETRRDSMSKNVSGVGRYLDDWLAGDGVGENSNQSYLRVKLNQQISETGAYYSNVRISGRVDLPRATERWKLIFESEQTEQNSIQDQRLSNIRPTEFSGGFSYELPERDDGFRFTHDIGVKGRIPLDPFYRFKTRYGHDINSQWGVGVDHKIWYYNSEGWGQDARLFFTRSIRDDMFLRFDTEVNYRDRYKEFEYAQTVALHQSLGERETLTYEAGIIGTSQPANRVESYYTQSVYRKAIHEDWLVMEFVPQLVMERDNHWNPDPRVQLNLEVYFFDF